METITDTISHPISLFQPTAGAYLVEGVGGVVGGAVGGVAAGFVGILVAGALIDVEHHGGHGVDFSGLGVAVAGLTVGVPAGFLLGTPAGVSITGKILGDKGSYWKSLLGAGLGTAVGFVGLVGVAVLSAGVNVPDEVFIGMAIASVTLFPAIGAVWGYNRGKKDK